MVWDEMVLLKMMMKIGPPTMRGLLVMMKASISPSQREVPPAESLRRRAKVLLLKFRLMAAVPRPKVIPLFFSMAKSLIYQKMGARGSTQHQGAPGGVARLGAMWAPGGSPLVHFSSSIFYIFQNNSPWNFSSFGEVQNRYICCSFFRPWIPAAGIPPLCVNLAY